MKPMLQTCLLVLLFPSGILHAQKAKERCPVAVAVTKTSPICSSPKGSLAFSPVNAGDLYNYNFNKLGFSTQSVYDSLLPESYPLTVFNVAEGCYLDTTIILTGEANLVYAPNSYTGNGDEFNRLWQVVATCADSMECRIFDRWGTQLKVFTDFEDGWDAWDGDHPVPEGTYSYLLRITFLSGETRIMNGQIYVLR